MPYICDNFHFLTLEEAKQYAERNFQASRVVLGIEEAPENKALIIVTVDALKHYVKHLEGCLYGVTDKRAIAALTAQLNKAQDALAYNLKRLKTATATYY